MLCKGLYKDVLAKKNHAMENHFMEIHVSRGIVVHKYLPNLKIVLQSPSISIVLLKKKEIHDQ